MDLKNLPVPAILKADRITLRTLSNEDRDFIFSLYSDYNSSLLDDWVPFTKIKQADDLIERSRDYFINKSDFRFGIEDNSNKRLVGSCGVCEFDEWNKKCMIYYQVHHNDRNNGFASEAVKLLVSFLFNDIKANRIEAIVTPGNNSSVRVLEKNGFKNEGTLREMEYYKGKFWDGIVMAIIKRDYAQLN